MAKKLMVSTALVLACGMGTGVVAPSPAAAGNDLLDLGAGVVSGVFSGKACAHLGGTAAGVVCGIAGAAAGYYTMDKVTDFATQQYRDRAMGYSGYDPNAVARQYLYGNNMQGNYRYATPNNYGRSQYVPQQTAPQQYVAPQKTSAQMLKEFKEETEFYEALPALRLRQAVAFCMNITDPASLDAENREHCGPVLNRTPEGRAFLTQNRPDLLKR